MRQTSAPEPTPSRPSSSCPLRDSSSRRQACPVSPNRDRRLAARLGNERPEAQEQDHPEPRPGRHDRLRTAGRDGRRLRRSRHGPSGGTEGGPDQPVQEGLAEDLADRPGGTHRGIHLLQLDHLVGCRRRRAACGGAGGDNSEELHGDHEPRPGRDRDYMPRMHGMVSPGGAIYAGSPSLLSATNPSPGVYTVTFDRDITYCTPIVDPYNAGLGVYGAAWAFSANTPRRCSRGTSAALPTWRCRPASTSTGAR